MGRSPWRWMAVALATAPVACVGTASRDTGKRDVASAAEKVVRDEAPRAKLTYADLDEMTRAYADRYMTLMNMAAEAVERDNPSIEQRRDANHARLLSVSSVYDIATNPDPFTRLLDMVVVVTLESQVLIDDALADRYFGERAEEVVIPIRRAREDIWQLAARALTPEQLHTLDGMIWEWHREHPEVSDVAFVRFDDFGASRSKSMVIAAASGDGLLVDLSESMRTVDEVRLLAERGFYLAKRLPITAPWSAKSILYETLAQPEIRRLLSDYHDVSQAAASAAGTFRTLPDRITAERESLERILHEDTGEIGGILKDYRAAVAETRELIGSAKDLFLSGERIVVELKETSTQLTGTIDAVDRTLARYERPKDEAAPREPASAEEPGPARGAGTAPVPAPAKPFDIVEYTAAAQELTRTVTELNRLVQSTNGLLEAHAWTTRVDEIDALGARQLERAQDKGRFVIDRAYNRATWLVAFLVGGLLLHASVWHFLGRRARAASAGQEGSAK